MNLDERVRQATEELLAHTAATPQRLPELYRAHARRTKTRLMIMTLCAVIVLVVGSIVLGRLHALDQPIGRPDLTGPTSSVLPDGVVASVPVGAGTFPVRLVAAGGQVWVGGYSSTVLARIDPATATVTGTVDIGQTPCELTSAARLLLAGPCSTDDSTVVVDLTTGSVRGRIADAAGPAVLADGSVWISDNEHTALKRIDPATLRVQHTFALATAAVAYDGNSVWVSTRNADGGVVGLVSIDPATNRVQQRADVVPMNGPSSRTASVLSG